MKKLKLECNEFQLISYAKKSNFLDNKENEE